MNLCVLSCCYEHPERAVLLEESCQRAHLPLVMCGEGKWPGSFRTGKILAARSKIREISAQYSHVLWTDGFDSLVLKGEYEILSRFRDIGRSMVFSVETNCYPDPEMIPRYKKNPNGSDWKYLNAGGWIGRTSYVLAAIEVALDHTQYEAPCLDSDQYVWSRALLHGILSDVALDYESTIFRTMWRHLTCDSLPEESIGDTCVVHYNGAVNMDGYVKMAALWEKTKRIKEGSAE